MGFGKKKTHLLGRLSVALLPVKTVITMPWTFFSFDSHQLVFTTLSIKDNHVDLFSLNLFLYCIFRLTELSLWMRLQINKLTSPDCLLARAEEQICFNLYKVAWPGVAFLRERMTQMSLNNYMTPSVCVILISLSASNCLFECVHQTYECPLLGICMTKPAFNCGLKLQLSHRRANSNIRHTPAPVMSPPAGSDLI